MNLPYSFDTSAIISAWREMYPPKVFSGLWELLEEMIQDHHVFASDVVLDELSKQDDDILAWAKERPSMFFPLSEDIQTGVRQILRDYPELTKEGRSEADPFVIAVGQVEGATVVTSENPSNNILKPKIPDVCMALNIPCIGLLQFVIEQGWNFPR